MWSKSSAQGAAVQRALKPKGQLERGSSLEAKRLALTSARLRYSPQTQPLRQAAIDAIVEQNLLLVDTELTIDQVESNGCLSLPGGAPALSRGDFLQALDRLLLSGRVVSEHKGRFKLAQAARDELWKEESRAEAQMAKTLSIALSGTNGTPEHYGGAFHYAISLIFSSLSQTYVAQLEGRNSGRSLSQSVGVTDAVARTKRHFPRIAPQVLETAVVNFLDSADSDSDAIKWNLAQNSFLFAAIGWDQSGRLLSSELFGNAALYLDTNVIIPALVPGSVQHRIFRRLIEACKKLGVPVYVTQTTIDELRRVYAAEHDLVEKVTNQIPAGTRSKVQSFLLPVADDSSLKEQVEEGFERPSEVLAERYGVKRIDDIWFIESAASDHTERLKSQLIKRSEERGGRPKREAAALHDALLLRWIAHERSRDQRDVWLVTRDSSLIGIDAAGTDADASYCLSLDALLQWIFPVLHRGSLDSEDVASDFASIVRSRLLPQTRIFDLEDFRIFSQLSMDCSQMPPDDVESCILAIKQQAGHLDPSSASDRERMAYLVQKFFKSPGRKYVETVASMEEINKAQRRKLDGALEATTKEASEQKAALTAAEAENETLREQRDAAALRASALNRLHWLAWPFLGLEMVLIYIAMTMGTGENWWQKILSSWDVLVAPVPIFMISCYIALGSARIKSLGKDFRSLFLLFRHDG